MRWGAREIARAYPSKWGREDVFMSNGGCRMRVSDENESNDVERASRVMSRVLDCSSLKQQVFDNGTIEVVWERQKTA